MEVARVLAEDGVLVWVSTKGVPDRDRRPTRRGGTWLTARCITVSRPRAHGLAAELLRSDVRDGLGQLPAVAGRSSSVPSRSPYSRSTGASSTTAPWSRRGEHVVDVDHPDPNERGSRQPLTASAGRGPMRHRARSPGSCTSAPGSTLTPVVNAGRRGPFTAVAARAQLAAFVEETGHARIRAGTIGELLERWFEAAFTTLGSVHGAPDPLGDRLSTSLYSSGTSPGPS